MPERLENTPFDFIQPEGRLTGEEREDKNIKRRNEIGRERLVDYLAKWWKGNAHTHSHSSTRDDFGYAEGVYSEDEIVEYSGKLGLEFVCFTEHSSNPGGPERQSEDSAICRSLLDQKDRIKELNKVRNNKAIALSGVEANIMQEGGSCFLDIPDEILQKLDLVIASRHAISKASKPTEKLEESGESLLHSIKEALSAATANQWVDVIGHPDRNIQFHPHDWNFFCKLNPEAARLKQEITELEKDKKNNREQLQSRYKRLKKIIGKIPLEENDDLITRELNHDFQIKEEKYLNIWEEILEQMAKNSQAFELNLKALPTERLLKMAVKKNLSFFINFDAHDFDEFKKPESSLDKSGIEAKQKWGKGQADEKELNTLRLYKQKRMSQGPGVKALLKILRLIKKLEFLGVTPDRIINSSKDRLLFFLKTERGKSTENLDSLG